ncbi:MAG: hypothetical protein L6R41_006776 [Letrouitia leprolyta]|nr:MAG: hypothetical protein L6R41_006776 [Letrouitia leprolyta]
MAPKQTSISRLFFMIGLFILFAMSIPAVDALGQSLCSTQNTGADGQLSTDNYQSNGKCFDTCKANYAFAVVQGKSCWCSDYAPADTTSLGSCNSPCPGFPYEQCGSSDFFGYIPLNKAPLGTVGLSQSQSSTSNPVEQKTSTSQVTQSTTHETTIETTTTSTSAQPTTHYVPIPDTTTSASSSKIIQTSQKPSTSSTLSTKPLDPDPSSISTWTPTPITSVMTVTGQVKTITITPTVPPMAKQTSQVDEGGGFMSHPGKVAGLFVGVGLIICLAAAAVIWLFLRRKRNAEDEMAASTAGGETPQRRQSKLSTMGLLGGTKRPNRKSVPQIQTSGWGTGNTAEKSPTDTPIEYRRSSYPRIIDQRLEPAALWNPLQDNGSHVSIQSFRDDQDYSRRMLRVANPDNRRVSSDD